MTRRGKEAAKGRCRVIYVVWMFVVTAALAAGTFLVVKGHPWFALGCFIIAAGYGIRTGKK